MRAFVDQELCIGCGLCAGTCPQVFVLGDDGKAQTVADTAADNRDQVLEAVAGCPVEAIREEE